MLFSLLVDHLKNRSCFELVGSPPPYFVVVVVADGLFGLYGSGRMDELLVGTPHPPSFPIPNKP